MVRGSGHHQTDRRENGPRCSYHRRGELCELRLVWFGGMSDLGCFVADSGQDHRGMGVRDAAPCRVDSCLYMCIMDGINWDGKQSCSLFSCSGVLEHNLSKNDTLLILLWNSGHSVKSISKSPHMGTMGQLQPKLCSNNFFLRRQHDTRAS